MEFPGKYIAALAAVSVILLGVGIWLLAISVPHEKANIAGWINLVFGIAGIIVSIAAW